MSKIFSFLASGRDLFRGFIKDEEGASLVEVAIWFVISIVVGAGLLAVLKVNIPALFESMIDKIKSLLVT